MELPLSLILSEGQAQAGNLRKNKGARVAGVLLEINMPRYFDSAAYLRMETIRIRGTGLAQKTEMGHAELAEG